jgi:hypothetical protein
LMHIIPNRVGDFNIFAVDDKLHVNSPTQYNI